MNAGAKRAEYKRCPKCGEDFAGTTSYCVECKKAYDHKYHNPTRLCACGKPSPHRKACYDCVAMRSSALVPVVCSGCDKTFELRGCLYRKAVRQNASGRIYCSRKCFHDDTSGRAHASGGLIKRRRGWSDERWEWEKKLVKMGLGMDRGRNQRLSYGSEENLKPLPTS